MTEEDHPSVTVSYNRKQNMGDYNSKDARVTFHSGDMPDASQEELEEKAEEMLERASIQAHRRLMKEQGMNLEQLADLEDKTMSSLEETIQEVTGENE